MENVNNRLQNQGLMTLKQIHDFHNQNVNTSFKKFRCSFWGVVTYVTTLENEKRSYGRKITVNDESTAQKLNVNVFCTNPLLCSKITVNCIMLFIDIYVCKLININYFKFKFLIFIKPNIQYSC